MEKITIDDFQELFNYSNSLSVSLYLATDEVGLQATKRKAELQNLEKDVMEQLQQQQVSKVFISKVKDTLDKVKSSDTVWDVRQKSLALFISPDFYRLFQLPITVKNLTSVSKRFHLKPLIQLLSDPQDFYVLSLSKKSVELYKGDRYEMKKVPVPGLPQTLEEVVGVETGDRHLQFHTSTTTPNGGGRPAAFHGQSMPWKDDKQRYLERFLQAVDTAVTKYLKDQTTPLIVSGVERMITTYHNVTQNNATLKDIALSGNDKDLSLSDLHQKSLQVLQPYFIQQEKEKLQIFLDRKSSSQFSEQLDEILRQAQLGRVDTIAVAQGMREWGQFDPQNLSVTYSDSSNPAAHDLLDTACAVSIMNGGKAYLLPPEQLPAGKHVIAVFRY